VLESGIANNVANSTRRVETNSAAREFAYRMEKNSCPTLLSSPSLKNIEPNMIATIAVSIVDWPNPDKATINPIVLAPSTNAAKNERAISRSL